MTSNMSEGEMLIESAASDTDIRMSISLTHTRSSTSMGEDLIKEDLVIRVLPENTGKQVTRVTKITTKMAKVVIVHKEEKACVIKAEDDDTEKIEIKSDIEESDQFTPSNIQANSTAGLSSSSIMDWSSGSPRPPAALPSSEAVTAPYNRTENMVNASVEAKEVEEQRQSPL